MVKESDFLISNQEIIGGLKTAINKGETLKEAMMTFYQAGYDKYEIEEAARAYLNQAKSETNIQAGIRNIMPAKKSKKIIKKLPNTNILPVSKPPIPANSAEQKENKTPQIISKYATPKKTQPPKKNMLTVFLILILLFLVGILAAVFLFQEELVNFVNNLFG